MYIKNIKEFCKSLDKRNFCRERKTIVKPLISIIVPIYNMESSLEKCVKTIKNQSYRNIEIILINDGSTDNTKQLCDYLATTDDRIQVIHKSNEGVSTTRNIGIKNSTGKYIMFVDPDDLLSTDIVMKLLKVADVEQSDITACCAYVENGNTRIKNTFYKEGSGIIDKERFIAQLFTNDYHKDAGKYIDIGVPWGKLYKASFVKEKQLLFNPSLRRNQDNIFNLYALYYANKIAYLDEPLYYYDYEHFKSGSRKVTNDAVELYTNLASEFVTFYNKFYSGNQLYKRLLKKRLSLLLIAILTNKVCHPKHHISVHERKEQMQQVCNSSPFFSIFNEKIEFTASTKTNLILVLLKYRKFKLVYSMYYFGFKLNL